MPGSELSPEFIDLVLIVMPYVKERGSAYFSIRELIDLTGTDVTTFYKTISSGLYKNPRGMIRAMRLIYVQQLLRTTNKSVEEISEECNFVSPNCMISSFYHQFRMTPREYRLSI